MKILLLSFVALSLSVSSHAAEATDTAKLIQELREEIAMLRVSLLKAQNQSVTHFASTVQLRAKYELAIQRVNEANDVARQWRSKSVGLQRELAYTKAIAMGETTVDLVKVYEASKTPHFRITNIPAREESVIRHDGVSPTYISMR
jgi:hypothetical protein